MVADQIDALLIGTAKAQKHTASTDTFPIRNKINVHLRFITIQGACCQRHTAFVIFGDTSIRIRQGHPP
jgi:hypothetical protein